MAQFWYASVFWLAYFRFQSLKFTYSEKATNFCEISAGDLCYVVTVKSTVEILQNFVAFSEYMNFTSIQQESNLRLLFFRKPHEDHMWRWMFRNETFFRSLFWPLQRYMITRLSNEEIWKSFDINYLPMIKISIFIWILQS